MDDHHDDVDAEYHKTADPGVGWAKKAKAWLDKFDEVTHKQIISDWENLLMWPIETSLEVKRSPKTNLTVKKVKVNEWCPSKSESEMGGGFEESESEGSGGFEKLPGWPWAFYA